MPIKRDSSFADSSFTTVAKETSEAQRRQEELLRRGMSRTGKAKSTTTPKPFIDPTMIAERPDGSTTTQAKKVDAPAKIRLSPEQIQRARSVNISPKQLKDLMRQTGGSAEILISMAEESADPNRKPGGPGPGPGRGSFTTTNVPDTQYRTLDSQSRQSLAFRTAGGPMSAADIEAEAGKYAPADRAEVTRLLTQTSITHQNELDQAKRQEDMKAEAAAMKLAEERRASIQTITNGIRDGSLRGGTIFTLPGLTAQERNNYYREYMADTKRRKEEADQEIADQRREDTARRAAELAESERQAMLTQEQKEQEAADAAAAEAEAARLQQEQEEQAAKEAAAREEAELRDAEAAAERERKEAEAEAKRLADKEKADQEAADRQARQDELNRQLAEQKENRRLFEEQEAKKAAKAEMDQKLADGTLTLEDVVAATDLTTEERSAYISQIQKEGPTISDRFVRALSRGPRRCDAGAGTAR